MYHIIQLNTESCHSFWLLNHRQCHMAKSTAINWEELLHHLAVATQSENTLYGIFHCTNTHLNCNKMNNMTQLRAPKLTV